MEDSEQPKYSENQRENKVEDKPLTDMTTVIQNLKVQEDNTHFCIPCAISFMDESEFTRHLQSDEHAFMVLVSGFDEKVTENSGDLLPPLFCCLLCNRWSFELNHYIHHLKGRLHKKVANHMMNLIFGDKNLNGIDNGCNCTSKMFGDLFPPLHYCELCEVWCKNCKHFKQHAQSKSHNKKNEFTARMGNFNTLEELESCSARENSESESLSQTDYCKLCNMQCDGNKSYKKHLRGNMHKKIKQFKTKISESKKENEISACLKSIVSKKLKKSLCSLKYCKFCHAWFKNLKQFRYHLKTAFHRRVKSVQILMTGSLLKEKILLASEDSVKLHPLAHHCKLCNITFSESEYSEQHMNSAIHKRTEQFINKICMMKENNVREIYPDTPNSDNIRSLLPLLHYCELCNVWSNGGMYNHSTKIHKTIETYISNINNKQVSDIIHPPFYCELCNIQFKYSKLYCDHLEGKFHTKVNSSVNRILNKKERN